MRSWLPVNAMSKRAATVKSEPRQSVDEPVTRTGRVGRLTGEAWLEIHTDQAQRLIRGRVRSGSKSAITGLLGFASQMNLLWQAAAEDDPYADWWLIRVEDAIAAGQSFFATQRAQVERDAVDTFRFHVSVSQSRRPQTLMLQFATPHAYRAAQLLGDYDALVCQCLTLKHVGACTAREMNERIALGAHRLRGVFSLPQAYRVFAINRTDVEHNTQRAQQAQAQLGELPAAVLRGEQAARYAPLRTGPTEQLTGKYADAASRPALDTSEVGESVRSLSSHSASDAAAAPDPVGGSR